MASEHPPEPIRVRVHVLPESERDGWRLALRGEPRGPWPKLCGDVCAFAPDESQVDIAWESDGPAIVQVMGSRAESWGVFQIRFPIPVMCKQDLVRNFHEVLPLLKECHALHLARQMASRDGA
jgi:hypothetical protein